MEKQKIKIFKYTFILLGLVSGLHFSNEKAYADLESCGACTEPKRECNVGCGETANGYFFEEYYDAGCAQLSGGDGTACRETGTCCLVCQPGDCGTTGGGGYCGSAPPPPLIWYQFGPTEDVNNVFYFWDPNYIGWRPANNSTYFMTTVPAENKGFEYYFDDDLTSVTVMIFQRWRPYYDGEHHDTWGYKCNGVCDGYGWRASIIADGTQIWSSEYNPPPPANYDEICDSNEYIGRRKWPITLNLEGYNKVELYAKSLLYTNGERFSDYGYPAVFIRNSGLPLTVTLFDESSPTKNQCTATADFVSDIEVSLYDSDNTFIASATTDANGEADFEVYAQDSGTLTACITSDIYNIACTNDPLFEDLTGKCAQVDFVDTPDGYVQSEHDIYLGLQTILVSPWSTSIGGDIFANTIFINPAEEPTNFYSAIINSIDSISGYAFTNDIIALAEDEIYEDEGGSATNFSETVYPHTSVHLDKFRFTPATSSTPEEWPSGNNFEEQETYEISVEDANDKFNSALTYSVSGDGVAVVYVTGTDETFEINGPVTATSGRIVLVVEGQTFISKDIGYSDTTGFGKDSTPNIMAGIISQGDIEFESEGTDPGSDIPIIVQAPLVSKNGIIFDRNLGPLNIDYPATSAKYYAKFLYELTKLERDQGYLNDTGFQKFDVQYIFQD